MDEPFQNYTSEPWEALQKRLSSYKKIPADAPVDVVTVALGEAFKFVSGLAKTAAQGEQLTRDQEDQKDRFSELQCGSIIDAFYSCAETGFYLTRAQLSEVQELCENVYKKLEIETYRRGINLEAPEHAQTPLVLEWTKWKMAAKDFELAIDEWVASDKMSPADRAGLRQAAGSAHDARANLGISGVTENRY